MASVTGMIVEFAAKTTQLDGAFKKTEDNMARLRQETKKTQTEFEQIASSAKKFLAVFGGTAAILTFMGSVSDATRKFSKSLADLSALTGATGKDLKFLSDASKEFGSTTLFSASEVAEAFKLVGGAKGDLLSNLPALKEVTKEVLTLASAAQLDLRTAALVTGATLNQFGLDASQASRVVNVLAAGSKVGSSEVNDLGESLKYVGAVASQSGLSLEETVAALEGLGADAIKGSEAGTGLRAVLIRLQNQANAGFNPAIVGLNKALENLAAANLDVTAKTEMFGLVNITAATSLIKNRKMIEEYTKAVTGSSTATEQANTQMDSYDARIRKLTNSWEGLKIAIGEAAESKSAIEGLNSVVNELTRGITEKGIIGGILIGASPQQNAQPTAADITRMNFGLDKGAGYTSPQVLESSIPRAPTEGEFIAKNAQSLMMTGKNGIDPKQAIQDSFIAPIISAGTQVERFAETAQQASSRLQNAFTSSFGDPAKKVADSLIGKMGKDEQEKFQNAANNIDPSFLKKTQEAASLVSQIQGARGSERDKLASKLEQIQNDLNAQAFSKSSSFGQYAVGTKMGGTFSVTGNSGTSTEEQQRVMQALIGDLNKFVSQQLDKETRVKLIVTIEDPSKPEWIKWMQGETEKAVKEVTKKAASQGAK